MAGFYTALISTSPTIHWPAFSSPGRFMGRLVLALLFAQAAVPAMGALLERLGPMPTIGILLAVAGIHACTPRRWWRWCGGNTCSIRNRSPPY